MALQRRLATLTVALVLAAPGAAFAQSAGDEQYEDPFGGDDQEQATPTPTPAPDTPVSSDDGTQAAAQATPTPTPAAGSEAAAQEQLPRTGNDPILPAVAGFWLLLGGVALRAKVRVR
jgi:LPXTG-motif cell wall-anchored protein